jgi:hypothetical protein
MLVFILLPLAASTAADAGDHMVIPDDRFSIRQSPKEYGLGKDGERQLSNVLATRRPESPQVASTAVTVSSK